MNVLIMCVQTPPDFTREGDSPNEIFPSLQSQQKEVGGPFWRYEVGVSVSPLA